MENRPNVHRLLDLTHKTLFEDARRSLMEGPKATLELYPRGTFSGTRDGRAGVAGGAPRSFLCEEVWKNEEDERRDRRVGVGRLSSIGER